MKWSGNDIAMYLSSPSSPPGPFRIGPYFQAERERKKQCSSKMHHKTTLCIVERKKKIRWYTTIKIQILVREKEDKVSFEFDLIAQSGHLKSSQHPSIYDCRDGALTVEEDGVPSECLGPQRHCRCSLLPMLRTSTDQWKLELGCHSERQLQCHINPPHS